MNTELMSEVTHKLLHLVRSVLLASFARSLFDQVLNQLFLLLLCVLSLDEKLDRGQKSIELVRVFDPCVD